ncbi:hypothetical protein [Oryza sativa Japonica Group]|uniref:Uncharacterized protein P0454A11.2 n=1 Tax=Oryza sativa subsp. japonica TaxID=39947 RepID=Q5N9J2_ORYSJ|nr:hypothetical protein [Oryza sativa Japonica Group]
MRRALRCAARCQRPCRARQRQRQAAGTVNLVRTEEEFTGVGEEELAGALSIKLQWERVELEVEKKEMEKVIQSAEEASEDSGADKYQRQHH